MGLKERVQSFVLALLVLLSLLLTYQLWFGQKPEEEISEDVYEPVFFEEPRLLTGIVTPGRILLYRDEAFYRLGPGETAFDDLWHGVSIMLQDLPGLAQEELVEGPPAENVPALALRFGAPLPAGPGTPWLAENGSRELSELLFWRLEDRFYLALQETGASSYEVYRLAGDQGRLLEELCSAPLPAGKVPYRKLDAGELSGVLDMDISVAGNLYVPAGEILIPELILREEILDQQALRQAFFVDHSLVREISERGGGLIYTDGEKGLRLNSGLDFSHPQLEQQPATLSYPAALYNAGKYLAYYGGWPDWLYLEELSQARPGGAGQEIYRCSWTVYYGGYPFVAHSDVRMVFNDSGLVEYQRHLHEPLYPAANAVAAAGYLEALQAALAELQELDSWTGGMVELEALALKYETELDTVPPRGVPVWLVRLDNVEIILEAGDLTLLKELAP